MGHPWHEIRHLEKEVGLVALSANFALYGDMSDRMASLVAALGHRHEVYSIDESFVDLSGIRGDMTERSHAIRARVLQWVGIPCGIGIAPTKTLAKLANYVAKTAERKPGSYPSKLAQVCNLAELPREELDAVLDSTEVGEVWGVGRKIAAQLKEAGIETVLDLARLDPATVRRRWSVVLERTVRELQGMPCIGLDDQPPPQEGDRLHPVVWATCQCAPGPGAGREHVCQHGSPEAAQAGQPHLPCTGVHSHRPVPQRAAVRPVHHRTAAAGHQRYRAHRPCGIDRAAPDLPTGLCLHQGWCHVAGLAQRKAAAGGA